MLPSPSHQGLGLRPFALSRLPPRSLTLRPGDSLTILKMAVSMGFRASVSLGPAIQATGPLVLAPAGLTPAERARLRWTHDGMKRLTPDSTWWHRVPHREITRSGAQASPSSTETPTSGTRSFPRIPRGRTYDTSTGMAGASARPPRTSPT